MAGSTSTTKRRAPAAIRLAALGILKAQWNEGRLRQSFERWHAGRLERRYLLQAGEEQRRENDSAGGRGEAASS